MNELPNSAMGALRLMPNKAKEVAAFSNQIVRAVQNGEANPLEVLAMLRALELLSKEVREEIQDNINTEAGKYPKGKFEAFGALMEAAEVYTEYDYTVCGDVDWERLDTEVVTATSLRKEREAFLRALKTAIHLVDSMTGEIVTVKPPIKRSKSGVKIYLR